MFNTTTKINQSHPKSGTGLGSLGLSLGVAGYLCLFSLISPVHADVIATGDVDPTTDPTDWNSNTIAYIGKAGTGTLDITDGSEVRSNISYIGDDSNSIGEVTVNGIGSMWKNSGGIHAGNSGDGMLSITNGGVVEGYGSIGFNSGSTGKVTIDGVGSLWWSSNSLYVGYSGNGKLTITNGGKVSHGGSYIGYNSGSVGEITVDGINSIWKIHDPPWGPLTVGHSGSGKLSIINDSNVTTTGNTWLSRNPGSSGTIHFNNGALTSHCFLGAVNDLFGTGTINTNSFVSDVDLVFDATHGLNQTFEINKNADQNITVNLNVNRYNYTGAGYGGVGTMSISDGITIESTGGYIGYKSESRGTVTVDGTDSTWANRGRFYVGFYGNGVLNITNGGSTSSNESYVGYQSSATGEVTVDGIDSTWKTSSFFVGYYGHGKLNITNGGIVNSHSSCFIGTQAGSKGEVTIDGVGSLWDNTGTNNLIIGNFGSGTLNITNGGMVRNGVHSYIGRESGSNGVVTVDGNSTWDILCGNDNHDGLYVGYSGNGTLNITGGSTVNVVKKDTRVAYETGSSGMIHFANGTLITSSLLAAIDDLTGTGTINAHGLLSDVDLVFDITHGLNQTVTLNKNTGQNITVNLDVDGSGSIGAGYGGVGTMSISDGINVKSIDGFIGYQSGSEGVVTIDGEGSIWTSTNGFFAGYRGNSILNITNGGVVDSRFSYIGYESNSTGNVTVDGENSLWTNNSILYIGRSGIGSLTIINGGTVKSLNSSIGPNASSTGHVLVDGIGSTWTSNRLGVGGFGHGMLNITNSGLVSVNGTLNIIDNGVENSYINMANGGMLAIKGNADDSLVDFLGLIGGTDAIRYWDDSISNWANITGATEGEGYTLSYLTEGDLIGHTMLTVLAVMPILGDINGDGLVDGFDVDPFIDVLLNGPYKLLADVNQDGIVNGFDVDPFVAVILGNTNGPNDTEVPEPTTLVLLSLAGLISGRRHY